jgi:hypothetical protein
VVLQLSAATDEERKDREDRKAKIFASLARFAFNVRTAMKA